MAEGSSDRMLLAPLRWLFRELGIDEPGPEIVRIPFERMPNPPDSLERRIRHVLDEGGWDLVLVHRDSDADRTTSRRVKEIREAEARARAALERASVVPVIPLVPVRATEAWLLFDERAIRSAAGNPDSRIPLGLPGLAGIEREGRPKERLHDALRAASGTTGRRRRKFEAGVACHRIEEFVESWQALERLPAFVELKDRLRAALESPGRSEPVGDVERDEPL